MLLGSRFPPDRRVEWEVIALAGAGHRVTVLCRRQEGQPAEETYRDLARVVRVNSFLYPLYSAASFGTNFIHCFWKRHLRRTAVKESAQAIHVHDLSHARTAVHVARQLGIRSVVDLHEYLPGQISQILLHKASIRLNPAARWIYNLKRWKKNQAWCLEHTDAAITICEEAKQLYCKTYGIDPAKIELL